MLSFFMPASVAIVLALALRIWLTVGGLLCFVVALKTKEPKLT